MERLDTLETRDSLERLLLAVGTFSESMRRHRRDRGADPGCCRAPTCWRSPTTWPNSRRPGACRAYTRRLTMSGLNQFLREAAPWASPVCLAVARIITDGRALLAHVVGTGKTATMVMAAAGHRYLGIVDRTQREPPKRPPRLGSPAARAQLGIAAFAPALGLMALRLRDQQWWWIPFAAAAAVGILLGIGVVATAGRGNREPYVFGDIEDASSEIIGHIGSYIVPVVIDPSGADQVLIGGAALALIIYTHIVTGNVLVSPLLSLAGKRTYRATTDTGVAYYLIARTDPALWSGGVECRALGSSILVEVPPATVAAGREGNDDDHG